ncbi:MAG: C4-type zinc ribbon domain-containing protein, partial [Desulfurobacteriaceae bacterium]
EQFSPEIQKLKEEIEEISSEVEILKRKKEKLLKEIEDLKSSIEPSEIERFEQLKNKFNGLVFSDISSGACEGCGMTYSPAEYRELIKNLTPGKSKCPYCGRFIYSRKLVKA